MLDILNFYITLPVPYYFERRSYMSEEWLERKVVQEMFSLTTKQFGRVMRNIKRRHEYDYYLWIKSDKDKTQKCM